MGLVPLYETPLIPADGIRSQLPYAGVCSSHLLED